MKPPAETTIDAAAPGVFPPGMKLSAAQHRPTRVFNLPNVLTYSRIVAVPLVVACMYWSELLQGGVSLRWVALAIFIIAGVTDILDGYVARMWSQQSSLGRCHFHARREHPRRGGVNCRFSGGLHEKIHRFCAPSRR